MAQFIDLCKGSELVAASQTISIKVGIATLEGNPFCCSLNDAARFVRNVCVEVEVLTSKMVSSPFARGSALDASSVASSL